VPILVWLHIVRRRAGASSAEHDACLLSIYSTRRPATSIFAFSLGRARTDHVVAVRNGEPLLFNATRRSVETIYHRHTETTSLSSTSSNMPAELTESALQQLSGEQRVGQIYAEALAPAETITAGNTGRVLDAVLHRFVDHFVFMPAIARSNFCNLVARLCLFGFVELKSMPEIDPPLHGVALVDADAANAPQAPSPRPAVAPATATASEPREEHGALDVAAAGAGAAEPSVASSNGVAAPAVDNDSNGAVAHDGDVDNKNDGTATTTTTNNNKNGTGDDDDDNDDDNDDDVDDLDDDDDDDDDASVEREMARLAAAALQERHLDLDKSLLQCFVEGVHIAVFDKDAAVQRAGRAALDALHKRATKLLDAKLLLSTNALLHSIANPQN
jgi:hypothetical protein